MRRTLRERRHTGANPKNQNHKHIGKGVGDRAAAKEKYRFKGRERPPAAAFALTRHKTRERTSFIEL
ncbi:hypothetical protein F2Q69_00035906 [Brassica cretica]|uniref:Uncharacterized protein n=1 Tax=Brassica cretica TaxID=69181 RepID=A0A8S9SQK0_BRACR|nr:hypothetical protein F2Q69_00035906 [Brassica cretica]